VTGNDRRVAIVTGGSQGIGASLVAGYLGRGWAVVANARTIGPSADPGVAADSYEGLGDQLPQRRVARCGQAEVVSSVEAKRLP
jgi:NAD(P)-dependent dehydrogenase (short-subunit alcohol dehydrogenase family)